MAQGAGKPDDTLSQLVEQLKRDALAWVSAERALLRAQVTSRVRLVEFAALMAIGALVAAIAAIVALTNVLVASLTPSIGPVGAGLLTALVLLAIAVGLLAWVRSLLHALTLRGRTTETAKVLWSALNEQN